MCTAFTIVQFLSHAEFKVALYKVFGFCSGDSYSIMLQEWIF